MGEDSETDSEHEGADAPMNPEQLWKHAQDLHELKPHMISAWRAEVDMKLSP